ncbi:MAG TPA: hypothetical protein V6D14_23825 [Coleofasciculaceae cyanobacterium]|jgi:hypothetical protein
MNQIKQKDNIKTERQVFSLILPKELFIKVITLLVLLYLAAIPFGQVKNKFEPTDVVILIVLLLFNSGLFERLGTLEYKDGGLKVELSQLKQEQEAQRDNIQANTNIIQRLSALERMISANGQEKQQITSLLDENELKHLKRLASDQTYLDYVKQQNFKQELRRLRTLGLIETCPGKQIGLIPEQGNLRDYVKLTERGKQYLTRREQAEQTEHTTNNSEDKIQDLAEPHA